MPMSHIACCVAFISPVVTRAQPVIHVEVDQCYHPAEVGNSEESDKSCS
jgi:hypothetical protein